MDNDILKKKWQVIPEEQAFTYAWSGAVGIETIEERGVSPQHVCFLTRAWDNNRGAEHICDLHNKWLTSNG